MVPGLCYILLTQSAKLISDCINLSFFAAYSTLANLYFGPIISITFRPLSEPSSFLHFFYLDILLTKRDLHKIVWKHRFRSLALRTLSRHLRSQGNAFAYSEVCYFPERAVFSAVSLSFLACSSASRRR